MTIAHINCIMDVLIIKNAPNEGPGNILAYLTLKGFEYTIKEAHSLNNIDISDPYRFLIILGGPMGVYEMDRYPFLKNVAHAIEKGLKMGLKVIGICLGAQLIAHVLGSKVYKGAIEEIGWCEIELSEIGKEDICFKYFNNTKVFQWHGDTFDLPKGAFLLASSIEFPNQAFKYGDAYGLQFHPEITPDLIEVWGRDIKDFKRIKDETEIYYHTYWHKAWNFFDAFFSKT